MSRVEWRRAVLAAGALVMVACAPGAAQTVYNPEELSERPQLRSPEKVADLIRNAYPAELKNKGVTGTVQIAFVVDEQGRVDAGSVKVMKATVAELGDAARSVAAKLEFKPGKKDAQAVRTQVVLPVVFR